MRTVQIVSESALDDLPDRLIVSPGFGRFSATGPQTYTSEGELVRSGTVLGRLQSADGTSDVCAPCDAWVMAYLTRDGEQVEPGIPLVHLRAL
jgi:biotin carboxyl carrier protein